MKEAKTKRRFKRRIKLLRNLAEKEKKTERRFKRRIKLLRNLSAGWKKSSFFDCYIKRGERVSVGTSQNSCPHFQTGAGILRGLPYFCGTLFTSNLSNMASASETGHAKNAAHFESLISFCAGYGASYNPSKAEIHMAALTALRTRALNSIGALNASKTAWTNASNVRRAAFAPLKKLCTQVINALDATASADKLLASDAKSINHKIQG